MANHKLLANRAASDAAYYRNKWREEQDRMLAAQQIIQELKTQNRKLRSMCKAAASEIGEVWESHCDHMGNGPVDLMARLDGKLPPDLYPSFDDA